jgi:hypothetical protein
MYWGNYTKFDNYRVPIINEFVPGFQYEILAVVYSGEYPDTSCKWYQAGHWQECEVGSAFDYSKDTIIEAIKEGRIRIKKERQMKNLVYLSEEGRRICTFIFDGMIIKLLPPLLAMDINLNTYKKYKLCTYINGVLEEDLNPNSDDYKKFNFDTSESTKEQRDFRDAWRYLLNLNSRDSLTINAKQELEEILLKHIIAIESEVKYTRKYEVSFDHTDHSVHKNHVFDVNKRRVELGTKFRTPGTIQKINYIKLIK